MNFFSHAYRYLDDAYFAAGTAVPDWLNALDRRVRTRTPRAAKFLRDADPRVIALCGGIIQHHHDDAWFHQTATFLTLNARLSKQLRDLLPGDASMRPGFVAHIAIELILDHALISQHQALDKYYEQISRVDPALVEETVSRISPRPALGLAGLIGRFMNERFLADYEDDSRLLLRMNHVLRRVGLEELPGSIQLWLQRARLDVHANVDGLLAGQTARPAWSDLV
jgi:hypothetical protein